MTNPSVERDGPAAGESESAAPSLSPTGEPAAPEHVGLALRAMLCAVLLGTAFTTVCLWGLRLRQASLPLPAPGGPPNPVDFSLAFAGTIGGVLVTVVLAWRLMAPLESAYRRGGLAMVAGFGTALTLLPAAVADGLFGPTGLIGYALLAVFLAWLVARRAARAEKP